MDRRDFLKSGAVVAGAIAAHRGLGTSVFADTQGSLRPSITHGIASGDVEAHRAVLWARADRPSRLLVELSSRPDFAQSQMLRGSIAGPASDFNAHAYPDMLNAGTEYFYRLRFESLDKPGLVGPPLEGRFKTAPDREQTIRFQWSGDTAGQGFGIDARFDGMLTYRSMMQRNPDFFVHCGDLIYADNPMQAVYELRDGSIWRNEMIEAKAKVAETTDEFRQNFYYNFLDDHLRDFAATTPVIQLWDDHEVVNNWYPGEMLDDDRYAVKDVDVLAARAKTAYFDCNPIRKHPTDPRRIYRKVAYGPLLDLFVIDLRSYRGPNTLNRQLEEGVETDILGADQLAWLKKELSESKATWKIICSDMPIGVVIAEWGKEIYEATANDEAGPPAGREIEFARLLQHIAREEIENVHFITADVHYCASHYYDPNKASFKDFKPFWEFVSGPLHAGTFGPNKLDATFGPQLMFKGIPDDLAPFTPPSAGYQFFGEMEIDGATQALTVRHFNRVGELLWEKTLEA